jgi:hypothetical protein
VAELTPAQARDAADGPQFDHVATKHQITRFRSHRAREDFFFDKAK